MEPDLVDLARLEVEFNFLKKSNPTRHAQVSALFVQTWSKADGPDVAHIPARCWIIGIHAAELAKYAAHNLPSQ